MGISPDEQSSKHPPLGDVDEDVRAALIEQEHRLLAAIANLARLVFRSSRGDQKRYLPASIRAVAWCLLPSAGTASVSILAIITLLVTIHQSSLLDTQNKKIEVQNVLAEAQRRSSLMFETVAIFQRIDEEKDGTDAVRFCSDKEAPCWKRFDGGVNERNLFVPSAGTVGRLAALTQALRPYRYLQVEGVHENGCMADTLSVTLDSSYQALLEFVVKRAELTEDEARQTVEEIYSKTAPREVVGFRQRFSSYIATIAGTSEPNDARLNCGPSSPERGQLLVSLHAAGVDISSIQQGGGNFTYADIPGANLTGIRLEGVSLNGSRLPGASFSESVLHNVQFREADLNNARFSGATISKSDFEGARLQVFERVGDAPWYFLPNSADDILLSGSRLYEENAAPNLKNRICFSLMLPSALTPETHRANMAQDTLANLKFIDSTSFGMLIETNQVSNPSISIGLIIFSLGLPSMILYGESPTSKVKLEYFPFDAC